MKKFGYFLSMLLVMGVSACATTPADDANANLIAAAIANPNRLDVDRERDARDKPEVTLALLDLQPGDAVVDLFGGGGYYAELLAGVVGPQGHVILHNNKGYAKWVTERLQQRYTDNSVPPITVLLSEVTDLKLPAAKLDAVVMIMSYHDLYFYRPASGFDRVDMADFFAQLRAALKPGGRLLIVDHASPDGTGNTLVQTTHRIEPAFVQKDIEGHGFNLVATSDVLRNPDDPRTMNVYAKDFRDKTDRFVMLFQKQ
jgi:predicted methyltransferase